MAMMMTIDNNRIDDFYKSNVSVVTMEPCVRTIRDGSKFIALPFPYLNFCFKYRTVAGGYCYPGQPGHGFSVFFSNQKPSKGVKFLFSPTDNWDGMVCTNHNWDSWIFSKREDMFRTMIDFWFGVPHILYADNIFYRQLTYDKYGKLIPRPIVKLSQWQAMTVEQAIDFNWGESTTWITQHMDKFDYIDDPIDLRKAKSLGM